MRANATLLAITLIVGWVLPATAVAADEAPLHLASLQDQGGQPADPEIDVEIGTETEGTVWYADPVWITLGVIGALVLILIIVLAARGGGGGTTVIREERKP